MRKKVFVFLIPDFERGQRDERCPGEGTVRVTVLAARQNGRLTSACGPTTLGRSLPSAESALQRERKMNLRDMRAFPEWRRMMDTTGIKSQD